MRAKYIVIGVVVGVLVSSAVVVLAGNLDPPSGPTDAASQMVTLDQIYDRLDDGTAATKMTSFSEPANGPGTETMHSLDEIYDLIGMRAPVPKTGQKSCYRSAEPWGNCTCGAEDCPLGQDGDLERGVAWPNPRFTDNGDGTVTDNLTGLIWLEVANCAVFFAGDAPARDARPWGDAVAAANSLSAGHCGLSDGSSPGDWRLPNVRELLSLVHYGFDDPALPNTEGWLKSSDGDPFTGVQTDDYYWSSTTNMGRTDYAWEVSMHSGRAGTVGKEYDYHVWPVRGGQ
jgi:hypothetical protein